VNKQEIQDWLEQNDSLIYDITESLIAKRDEELKTNPMFKDEIYSQFNDQLLNDVADEFTRENLLPEEDFYGIISPKVVVSFCLGVYNANSK